MDILADFKEKAKKLNKTIVLPEGDDDRVIDAAEDIIKNKLVNLILLGNDISKIEAKLSSKGVSKNSYQLINPSNDSRIKDFTEKYYELRKAKKMTIEEATASMKQLNFFASMLLKENIADGVVMGATYTTADVLRAGLRVVGTKEGTQTVSSAMIIVTDKKNFGSDGVLIFADCAVNPDPSPAQLADIAVSSAHTCESLLDIKAKVALLSFSTKGSAKSPSTEKVVAALEILKERATGIEIDGELQADAALIKSVADRKAPGSNVAGQANILVFPNLDAGNIGYKLVERLAGAKAIGPIIQGFDKPINDLSRGCVASDIVNVAAITALQSK